MTDFDIEKFWTRFASGAIAVVLVAVVAGATTCVTYDRNREAACASVGGELRGITGTEMDACYRVIAEPIPMPNVRAK